MDIGQIIHNTKYYDGYEGEPQITLTAYGTELPVLHIWDGHFEFIFGKPVFYEVPWHGFTRDCQHFEGVFDEKDQVITDLQEYIDDMLYYKDKEFRIEETRGAYELMLTWFIAAKELGCKEVLVRLD